MIKLFKYIFIDESGDLGLSEGSSKYLVLSALIVDNPSVLDRLIKNVRRNKFRKQLKKASEIKANKSNKKLIKYLLEKLNETKKYSVLYMILEKKKLHSVFLSENKDKLYNFVAGKLADKIILEKSHVEIRIDKSKGKQALRDDFNEYFLKRLKNKSELIKVNIYHSYSHSWSGLQFADLLAWAAFQKVEYDNEEYVDLIENKEVYYLWS